MSENKRRALLTYGTDFSAPKIELPDTDLFKNERGSLARNYFENRLELLNREYQELLDLAKENELIYTAEYNFVPRVGMVYHLYRVNGKVVLSLINPNEWDKEYHGSYEFTADSVWKRVDKSNSA